MAPTVISIFFCRFDYQPKKKMLLASISRCFVVYALIIFSFVIGQSDQFSNQINLKNQYAEEVDIFDMFHYSNDKFPNSPDDMLDRGSINKKENVHKSKTGHVRFCYLSIFFSIIDNPKTLGKQKTMSISR